MSLHLFFANERLDGLSLSSARMVETLRNCGTNDALVMFQKLPIHEMRMACLDAISRNGLWGDAFVDRHFNQGGFDLWKEMITSYLPWLRHPNVSEEFLKEIERLISTLVFCRKGQYNGHDDEVEAEVKTLLFLLGLYYGMDPAKEYFILERHILKPVLKRLTDRPDLIEDLHVADVAEKLMSDILAEFSDYEKYRQIAGSLPKEYLEREWSLVARILRMIKATRFVAMKSSLDTLRGGINEGSIAPHSLGLSIEFNRDVHLAMIDNVLESIS